MTMTPAPRAKLNAIGKRRRFIGTELHPIYWRQGVKNLQNALPEIDDLFASAAA